MSDRSRDPFNNDNAKPDSKASSPGQSPSTTIAPPRTIPGIRSVTSPIQPRESAERLQLPPLPQAAPTLEGTQPSSNPRLASFSSILNAVRPDATPPNRRRKASELEHSTSPRQSLPPIISNAPRTFAAPTPLGESIGSQHHGFDERPQRRILTPRSPALHRTASLGQLNQPTGQINAQRTPFPTSPYQRAYTIEPGSAGAPPLPTAASTAGSAYASAGPDRRPPRAVRGSGEFARNRNLSSSASPSTSYSSYSQASQTSPLNQYAPTTTSSSYPPATSASDYALGGTNLVREGYDLDPQRPVGIPITSSGGQNVYQMMTLETTSGTVQLPVDVQAASRVADEKRRRNAGASARFRQRRKEKEREASSTISRLEQQVKEFSEDADFYRRERDYLAGVLSQIPGGERHFPRPPSPRQRRASSVSLPGPSGIGSAAFPRGQDQLVRSPDQGRNVRRRTSTMSLPPPPSQPQQLAPGTPMQPAYAPPAFGGPLAPPPPPPAGSQRVGPLQPPAPAAPDMAQRPPQLPGLPQILQPMAQWGPYPGGQADPGASRDGR